VHVLSMFMKFGCDMCSPLPAYQNLTFQVMRGLTAYGSSETSALPECRNCLVFTFLAEFAFESITDRALHRGNLPGPL